MHNTRTDRAVRSKSVPSYKIQMKEHRFPDLQYRLQTLTTRQMHMTEQQQSHQKQHAAG